MMREFIPSKLNERTQTVAPETTVKIIGNSDWATLPFSLYQRNRKRPQVIALTSEADLEKFSEAMEFYSPEVTCHRLPGFDVGLYSNLYPSSQKICQRLSWLHHAQTAEDGVFVGTITSLLQRTMPLDVLDKLTFHFKVGDEIFEELPQTLDGLGYNAAPYTEDVGHYSFRGGILDIFSPACKYPVRIELFGNTIDSIKRLDPTTHRSNEDLKKWALLPTKEVIYRAIDPQAVVKNFTKTVENRPVDPAERQQILQDIARQRYFNGIDFLLAEFYEQPELPLQHFISPIDLWLVDETELVRTHDKFLSYNKSEFDTSPRNVLHPDYQKIFAQFADLDLPNESTKFSMEKIDITSSPDEQSRSIDYRAYSTDDFSNQCKELLGTGEKYSEFIKSKFLEWKEQNYIIFVSAKTESLSQRLKALFETADLKPALVPSDDYSWHSWSEQQKRDPTVIHIIPRQFPRSFRNSVENQIVLRDSDFFARTASRAKNSPDISNLQKVMNFTDLNTGDMIVHKTHGVGIYEGLKAMEIRGAPCEFIQLSYKGGDKLYLPVYRISQIHKYSGPGGERFVDKLGGTSWEKAKTKVKNQLRDIAADLLKLYAKRTQAQRPPFSKPDESYFSFENKFPYEETEDQIKAIEDILTDMTSEKPMDRLICGDVGFGKTEVAMRAAFKAVEDGRQVAIVAPTTILTFQHKRTFEKRFEGVPVRIEALNRFVAPATSKKIVKDLSEGKIDIIIGTHRLFSQDVKFKDLGLLIIDEEQKFGVKHKEKIRKLKAEVDTLAMSATPIPRTLNMSLVGIRDLSLITTPPVDRLPTRTFVCKYDSETIRKAVLSELQRGGQVFFLHNRIMSIEGVASDLRQILPEVKIKIAHGQMAEGQLEKTMVEFFNKEIDVLVCTAIIESGMDIPRANTMFINEAQQFGLSQLYQLRGRVGRSKQRAYCYLLISPEKRLDAQAQERLRVIQENTELGSGIRVAQHDLELRGAGNLLGENQSGHVNAVGYELYLELLEEAIRTQRGEAKPEEAIEPEINVRIPALIPDKYISDIRIRLSYYKAMSNISDPSDLDAIEEDLRDQFGKPPQEIINLMGLMLIRKYCKDLGVIDLSSGKEAISLTFTKNTPLPAERVVELSSRQNKKYSVTPENRFKIRMKEISWPRISEELLYLLGQCKLH